MTGSIFQSWNLAAERVSVECRTIWLFITQENLEAVKLQGL
jgi:hypothetical protein